LQPRFVPVPSKNPTEASSRSNAALRLDRRIAAPFGGKGHMIWQGDHPIAAGAQKVNFKFSRSSIWSISETICCSGGRDMSMAVVSTKKKTGRPTCKCLLEDALRAVYLPHGIGLTGNLVYRVPIRALLGPPTRCGTGMSDPPGGLSRVLTLVRASPGTSTLPPTSALGKNDPVALG